MTAANSIALKSMLSIVAPDNTVAQAASAAARLAALKRLLWRVQRPVCFVMCVQLGHHG
jgi:hypothetical protein